MSQSHRTDQGNSEQLEQGSLGNLPVLSRNPTVLIRAIPRAYLPTDVSNVDYDRRNPTVLNRAIPSVEHLLPGQPAGRPKKSQSHRTDQGNSKTFETFGLWDNKEVSQSHHTAQGDSKYNCNGSGQGGGTFVAIPPH